MPSAQASLMDIFWAFFRLGCTSFGGPIAHLGFFRTEFVERRRWLSEHSYADLVALCQFLPGPTSSQVGIGLGLMRGGIPGSIAAWVGFTLPSALLLALFAMALSQFGQWDSAWLHGLKIAAVAVVAQALRGMGKSLCPDWPRASLALAATAVLLLFPGAWMQLAVLLLAALIGWVWLRPSHVLPHTPFTVPIGRRTALLALLAFGAVFTLLALPASPGDGARWLFDTFFRAGALVFGGGHVVLPLLNEMLVPTGHVSSDAFLAGYGAAQAIPGPLFSFAAFLGAAHQGEPSGWSGAALATVAIFLPSFFYVIGVLPLWESLRRYPSVQKAMLGTNAAVVGLLLAAFYHPVWTGAILSWRDFALACAAYVLLEFWKWPSWLVVALCAVAAGVGWSSAS